MLTRLPHPRCGLCAEQASCASNERVRPEFPDCRQPLRPTRRDHPQQLLEWLAGYHAIRDPRLAAVLDVLFERFAGDRLRFSEILEPSCSWDSAGWHLLRFSYGFPAFAEEPEAVAGTVRALAAPFAASWAPWLRRALVLARGRAVEHPIVGLAYDPPGRWRWKLYLQFVPAEALAALELVQTLTGARDLSSRLGSPNLHMVGFDFGEAGLARVKLYVQHDRVNIGSTGAGSIGPVALFDDLVAGGHDHLRNVLAIHKMSRSDDPELGRVREIDFALAENDLDVQALSACPSVGVLDLVHSPLQAVAQRWPLTVRRVSAPLGPLTKFNLYYVLTAMASQ